MGRHLRFIPSAVIAGAVFGLAACVPPPPPIIPNPPVAYPIPAVVPQEICRHRVVPGSRFVATVTERGMYAFDWRNSVGLWFRSMPFWYERGDKLTVETNLTFHVVWAPTQNQGETFHVVSADYSPAPSPIPCPDF